MAKVHPLIPDRKVRWGLDNYLDTYPDWSQWGGLNEVVDHHPINDPFSSEVLDKVLNLAPRDTYTITDDQYRPDLIAYRIYGHTQYWQIILFYNGVVDIGKLRASTELRFPALQDLESVLLTSRSSGKVVVDPRVAALKT